MRSDIDSGSMVCFRTGPAYSTVVPFFVALLLSLSGCRPYHMYTGEPRNNDEISTIQQSKRVLLLEIDGGDTGLSNQFRLLPGEHVFVVQIYRIDQIPSAYAERRPKESRQPVCNCQLHLDTWAGATYLFDSKELPGDAWIAWVRRAQEDNPQADPENLPHCTCAG